MPSFNREGVAIMNVMALIKDESGGATITMLPFLVVLGVMMFALEMNVMLWDSRKNELQIMADMSSRAGAMGVSTSYAVKERNGHGLDNYHVYVELDKEEANTLAERVYDSFDRISRAEINSIEINPVESFLFPVWNSKTFSYDQRSLSKDMQYKNGNYSVLINAQVKCVWPKLIGIPEKVNANVYSQSAVNGKVTGYK